MDNRDYCEANRAAWNAAMPYHQKAKSRAWDQAFSDPDFICQQEPELSLLQEQGIASRDIVHLCCNNGIELMSLRRLGAGRCVGFDISDNAILDAKSRSARFGISCEFYQSNVYEIPHEFHACFDLVYFTIGALCWLPDLVGLFKVASMLLRAGGKIFIYDQHPFTTVLTWDVSDASHKPVLEHSYFVDECCVSDEGLDYYGNVPYHGPTTYEFTHKLSDIMGAILENQFRITLFKEYDHDISCGLAWVRETGLKLPLSYILCAEKG